MTYKKGPEMARRGINEISPYVPGKPIEEVQKEYGLKEVIKMASNENPIGVSPKAITAMATELAKCNIYPEGSSIAVREKLAEHWGLDKDLFVVSTGADDILYMIANAFMNEGDEAIFATPSFASYDLAVRFIGGKSIQIPLKNYAHDLDAFLAAVTPKTKLMYICNPNNPTGTVVGKAAMDAFMDKVPKNCLVVMDEAYYEYVETEDYPSSINYLKEGRNVIITRTFSKVYGLAALRVGYGMARADVMETLCKVAPPFPVNRVAQVAACAAINDKEFTDFVLRTNHEGKEYLYKELAALGFVCIPTQANFIFVDFKTDGKKLFEELMKRGIIIRPGYLWEFPSCGRITIGTMEQNKKLVETLKAIQAS